MTYTLPDLPPLLEPYRDQIAASVRPYVQITIEGVRETNLWESKFGGYPYLPKAMPYPRNPDGEPMVLIAQINFADVPHLEHYPEQGILQFYNAKDKYELGIYHGLDYKHPTEQKYWRILYHPHVIQDEATLTTDFSFLPDDKELQDKTALIFGEEGQRSQSLALSFERGWQPVFSTDFHFHWLLSTSGDWEQFAEKLGEDQYELLQQYSELFPEFESQIGGYASFTQHDPRWNFLGTTEVAPLNPSNPSLLLLQIMGDFEYFIWGHDEGECNLFIDQNDLIARDFSRVLYSWDCA